MELIRARRAATPGPSVSSQLPLDPPLLEAAAHEDAGLRLRNVFRAAVCCCGRCFSLPLRGMEMARHRTTRGAMQFILAQHPRRRPRLRATDAATPRAGSWERGQVRVLHEQMRSLQEREQRERPFSPYSSPPAIGLRPPPVFHRGSLALVLPMPPSMPYDVPVPSSMPSSSGPELTPADHAALDRTEDCPRPHPLGST